MRALVLVLALAVLASTGAAAQAAGGNGVISAAGVVGKLQIDKSTRADVLAFAGKPDAEVNNERVFGYHSYDAVGYDCSDKEANDNFTLGNSGPYCKTMFVIDIPSHSLEDFATTSSAYHVRGVSIGTAVSAAQRALRTKVDRSCLVVLKTETAKAKLRIDFVGGRADAFAVHSLRRTSGLFHCMA
jgi:hypothetical protein